MGVFQKHFCQNFNIFNSFISISNGKLLEIAGTRNYTEMAKNLNFRQKYIFQKITNASLLCNFVFLLTDSERYFFGIQCILLVYFDFERKITGNRWNPEQHRNGEKSQF